MTSMLRVSMKVMVTSKTTTDLCSTPRRNFASLVSMSKHLDQKWQLSTHLQSIDDTTSDVNVIESSSAAASEHSDEFIRNFFIKFGMKKTLEAFQQEWSEHKARAKLPAKLPDIPEIYRKNAELSDELAALQTELDEARIIAEKARSTYDKLRKQRDFQKINHRRVQQEKQKLSQD